MTFYEKVQALQIETKAPKNLENTFGKYKYRNAEGILEAVKPNLQKYGLTLLLTDAVEEIGGRVFIKACATLYDTTQARTTDGTGEPYSMSATAFAEISEHKGMSADQTTGTASSYARKYALNGLLLLDDTKDADSDEFKRENDAKAKTAVMITAELLGQIKTELLRTGKEEDVVCNRYGAGCLEELTKAQAESALRGLRATK